MKICILNGSPKGSKDSITVQYIHYSEQLLPEHDFKLINVGQLLNNMKIQKEKFQQIIETLNSADGIIWAFPIYTTLIPAQLKKFIELLFEYKKHQLSNKYTICLSTSMKFFDITAHNYMRAVCEDLGMKYSGYFSAHTYDFLDFEGRKKWYSFLNQFLEAIKEKQIVSRRFTPVEKRDFDYIPKIPSDSQKIRAGNRDIIILTDYIDKNSNLFGMIKRFKECFNDKVQLYNLSEAEIKGGCLGCLKCGLDNNCVYNDEFSHLFEKVKNTDILVCAGTITDRFLSSQWKLYLDRSFCNGHTPSMEGTQVCFLVSGPLSQNENLREWMTATTELGFGNLVDVVTDEFGDSTYIDNLIYNMAESAVSLSKQNYISPSTFYKEGGYKIFRDMIFDLPGALFRMDFKFFKERDMFDFPTRNWKGRISRAFLSFCLKSKRFRKKFKKKLPSMLTTDFHKKLNDLDFNLERKRLKKQ
jgi:multimeric flavodoxin WrbA